MPANPVAASEALARGLKTDFVETYRAYNARVEPMLSRVMNMSVASDKSSELYAYFESAPHPARWPRGQELEVEGFGARQYSVANHDFSVAVDWHDNDEQDDQTGSLVSQAQTAGANFATLAERLFFQVLLGTTDLDLLPVVPTAPDGAAFFSATDGSGGNRFGTAGGNIFAGTGTTVAQITADVFTAITRMRNFQDTKGQPLFPAEMLQNFIILYGANATMEQNVRTAFQARTVQGTAAGISNINLEGGLGYTLWSTPRITDNRIIVIGEGIPQKPVFRQVRQEVRDNLEDFTNSDRTRRTKLKRLQWDARFGIGLNLPYQAVQITN